MKKTIALLFIISLVFSLQARSLKILAIGNSFSEDAIEQNLWELGAASGDTLVIGVMYIGGSALEAHYNNLVNNADTYSYRKIVQGVKTTTEHFRLIPAIEDEDWDVIAFQQVSSLSGKIETFFPYLTNLIALIRPHVKNPGVRFGLQTTWAYAQNSTHEGFANFNHNQMEMFNAIVVTMNMAAKEAAIDVVIPSGTAIQNGRTSFLGDTFCRDGFHLDLKYGRYTAACTWYEALLQKPVTGNTYIPEGVSPDQAEVAQKAAHFAVENPLVITALDR